MDLKQRILDNKIIVIARKVDQSRLVDFAAAVLAGGIDFIEITIDQKSEHQTFESIALLKEKFGEKLNVGAGTVLCEKQVIAAKESGAQYIISPNVNPRVIQKTKESGMISIPGAFTPTEICAAYDSGADLVKIFPASLGGPDYIKTISQPLSHIPLIVMGGITPNLIKDYLAAGASGFGIGGGIVNKEYIERGQYHKITAAAKSYREKII